MYTSPVMVSYLWKRNLYSHFYLHIYATIYSSSYLLVILFSYFYNYTKAQYSLSCCALLPSLCLCFVQNTKQCCAMKMSVFSACALPSNMLLCRTSCIQPISKDAFLCGPTCFSKLLFGLMLINPSQVISGRTTSYRHLINNCLD